jgi:hypothetical protein
VDAARAAISQLLLLLFVLRHHSYRKVDEAVGVVIRFVGDFENYFSDLVAMLVSVFAETPILAPSRGF